MVLNSWSRFPHLILPSTGTAICRLVAAWGIDQGAKVIQTLFDGVRHAAGRFRFAKVAGFIGHGKELHDVEAEGGIMDLVVSEFATNGSNRITKFTSPFLASGPLDVRNDDEDDDVLAYFHAISIGFRGLRTKAFGIDHHLDADIELHLWY